MSVLIEGSSPSEKSEGERSSSPVPGHTLTRDAENFYFKSQGHRLNL